MVTTLRSLICVLCVVIFTSPVSAQAIANWPASATWSPHSASRGVSAMGAITSPLPFIGVTPCRILDTRNPAGAFGGPAFSSEETRTYAIPAGPCAGIPYAAAYSLNFTVVDMIGAGFLTAWTAGTARPLVSTLDYAPAEGAIANAAVVAASLGGGISIYVALGTNVIIDINGYYAGAGVGSFNTFLGSEAGNFTMTGYDNTGIGSGALRSNTSGALNTAIGFQSLYFNTSGGQNTAIGGAMYNNSTGSWNTAVGFGALSGNSTGHHNTAIGNGAMFQNLTGNYNTALGWGALYLSTGSANIGIGYQAGSQTTGSNDIYIGNAGVSDESDTIRIGSSQAAVFIAGVRGITTGGTAIPVLIDANGQLGTISSFAGFKEEIQDMGDRTEGLLQLRPVTFRYKAQRDGRTQFGLIAEEVEKVMPELVVCSASGEAETVLYHEMPAMLLNELQKQQREIQELKAELSALRAAVSASGSPNLGARIGEGVSSRTDRRLTDANGRR